MIHQRPQGIDAVASTHEIGSQAHPEIDDILGVSQSQEAYKANPLTDTYETYTGLNSPYTYSDMTGFALGNVTPIRRADRVGLIGSG